MMFEDVFTKAAQERATFIDDLISNSLKKSYPRLGGIIITHRSRLLGRLLGIQVRFMRGAQMIDVPEQIEVYARGRLIGLGTYQTKLTVIP